MRIFYYYWIEVQKKFENIILHAGWEMRKFDMNEYNFSKWNSSRRKYKTIGNLNKAVHPWLWNDPYAGNKLILIHMKKIHKISYMFGISIYLIFLPEYQVMLKKKLNRWMIETYSCNYEYCNNKVNLE